jgi:hypothetical protein
MKKLFRTKNLLSEQFLSPSFLEYEDCVFLACQFSEENYLRCLQAHHKESASKKESVETAINHVHVNELFVNPPAKVTARLAQQAGQVIRDVWKLKLQLDFPNRGFQVDFSLEEPPEMSEITFYQVSSKDSLETKRVREGRRS